MTTRTILITGANGFTGGHACDRFAEAGWEVIALLSPRSTGIAPRGSTHSVSCDLTDAHAVLRLLERLEPAAILHLAGRNSVDYSWREPASTLTGNLMSTVNLLEGARVIGSSRLLVVGTLLRSSTGELSGAAHPYGFSKTLQVEAAKAWHRWYGISAMIAEPSNLIGPGGNAGLCGKIARWAVAAEESGGEIQPFKLSSLEESRDFLDVRDAVAGYEIVLNEGKPGETYALESGTFRTLGDVRKTFDEASLTALPWLVGNAPQPASPPARDTSAIRALGWKPVRSFRGSIEDALEEERARRLRERGGSAFD